MGQLDDLIQQLASEGTREASGSFEIDAEAAREKIQQFQLVNPYEYVVELVQAMQVLGAQAIKVEMDSDELWMKSNCSPLTAAELRGLYAAAMGSMDTPRALASRLFAVALNAITNIRPAVVRIICWDEEAGQGAIFEQIDDEDFTVRAADPEVDEILVPGIFFYVRERFRAQHLVEFFSSMTSPFPEQEILTERCQFSEIPIEVNGFSVARGLALPEQHATETVPRRFDMLGFRGQIAASRHGRHAIVFIVQHGVLIDTITLDEDRAPFVCVIDAPALKKDLSQRAFVRDDGWEQMFSGVLGNQLRWTLLDMLEKDEDEWPYWTRPLMLALMRERVEAGGLNAIDSVELAILKACKTFPCWTIVAPGILAEEGYRAYNELSIVELRRGMKRSILYAAAGSRSLGERMIVKLNEHTELLAKYLDVELVLV